MRTHLQELREVADEPGKFVQKGLNAVTPWRTHSLRQDVPWRARSGARPMMNVIDSSPPGGCPPIVWTMAVPVPRALAGRVVLAFSAIVPANELWRLEVFTSTRDFVVAAVATALYLPLHLRHVAYGLQGRRPAGALLTLAIMTAVMIAAWLVIGQLWVFMFASLAVSIMCTLPMRVGVTLAAALALSPLLYDWSPPLTSTAYSGQYLAITLVFRSTCLFVLVWLVAASSRLHGVQAALAGAVVQEERMQMQAELRSTIGSRLGELAALADRADTLADACDPAAEDVLREVISTSRATLAHVKGVVASYQRVAARDELQAAAALLTGAGIDAGMVQAARDRGGFVLPAQIGTAAEQTS